jgi:hypothetical protein
MNKIRIMAIVVIGIVTTVAFFMSQCYPRESLSHYLCWIAAVIGLLGIGYFLATMEVKDDGE